LNNGLATISKRSWNGAGIGARKLLGILSPGASGKKCVATRRAPKLLDLGELDAVIFSMQIGRNCFAVLIKI
jgi:hypothetical protein